MTDKVNKLSTEYENEETIKNIVETFNVDEFKKNTPKEVLKVLDDMIKEYKDLMVNDSIDSDSHIEQLTSKANNFLDPKIHPYDYKINDITADEAALMFLINVYTIENDETNDALIDFCKNVYGSKIFETTIIAIIESLKYLDFMKKILDENEEILYKEMNTIDDESQVLSSVSGRHNIMLKFISVIIKDNVDSSGHKTIDDIMYMKFYFIIIFMSFKIYYVQSELFKSTVDSTVDSEYKKFYNEYSLNQFSKDFMSINTNVQIDELYSKFESILNSTFEIYKITPQIKSISLFTFYLSFVNFIDYDILELVNNHKYGCLNHLDFIRKNINFIRQK